MAGRQMSRRERAAARAGRLAASPRPLPPPSSERKMAEASAAQPPLHAPPPSRSRVEYLLWCGEHSTAQALHRVAMETWACRFLLEKRRHETTESGAWWEGVSQRRADAPRFCGVLHAATVGPPGGRRREEKQHTPSQGESLVGDRHGILCGGAYCPWSEPVPILRPCRGHVGPGRAQTVGEARRPRPRAASRACHRAVGC